MSLGLEFDYNFDMNIDKIIITLGGILVIIFIYWFFFGKKEKAVAVGESIDIIVKGGYSPSAISAKKGKPLKLNFLRQDPSACLEEVVLADFKIRRFLPVNKKIIITLTPEKTGRFSFSCGMNMYHGQLIIHE